MKKIVIFIVILGIIAAGIYYLVSLANGKTPNLIPSPPASQESATTISKGGVPDIGFNLPQGFVIHTFAKDLGSPRDLVFTPKGTLLVSLPGRNEVVALVDRDHDGVAEETKVVVSGQVKPHGLAFHNGQLFVSGVTDVNRYNFDEDNLSATLDKKLFSLSNNTMHDKRSLFIDDSGKLFISVPSSCNACNQDLFDGGSVIVSDVNGAKPKVFAKGLRNATFMAKNPETNQIWISEMGRDNLGDDIPPDEVNILEEGKDYGWPKCFGNKVWDQDFNKTGNGTCESTTAPIFEIPAHSAPLGLTFIDSKQFPTDWQGDLLVSFHGSWNRTTPAGFKIVHLNVDGNNISGSEDFMTGFLNGPVAALAKARPVDLIFDREGNLYLSDDRAGNVYIIQKE